MTATVTDDAARVSALTKLLGSQSRGVVSLALSAARELLGMDMAYVSAMSAEEQVYVKTDGSLPIGGHDGFAVPVETTICHRVLVGQAPNVIPDTAAEPGVEDLVIVQAGLVGAYIGVPITFSDGAIFGTFCCMNGEANDALDVRDVEFVRVVARIVGDYLERELLAAQAEATRKQSFARVVHDLRSPLQAIVGYGGLLLQKPEPSYAETIVQEAQRLSEMLTELLEAQTPSPNAPFDVARIVADQASVFDGQSALHEIRVSVPAEGVWVLGVRERTANVVSNLLSNALKYSPAGGPVTVEVGADGTVSVADTGLGIPDQQATAIFTRFFRVESDATRDISGTGLGLAFSYESIRDQGGTMWFESTEGEGSTFSFRLPLTSAPA